MASWWRRPWATWNRCWRWRLASSCGGSCESTSWGLSLGKAGTLRFFPAKCEFPTSVSSVGTGSPAANCRKTPIPAVAPDLAVEVLSEGNTEGEMRRKLQDYFTAGVRLVWYIDPRTRTAAVYTSPEQCTVLGENDMLTGGDVLPGFELPLRELFAEIEGK